tara:strand:+ start:59 stop:1012 length:954 start_codon:yes stop_codon:yes gene_type:complete
MATIRKHRGKWQTIVRINGHPSISKVFESRTDAKRYALVTETKLRREDAGISKINFPKFEDLARRYIEEISVHKRCHRDERYTILNLIKESWSCYPIHRIKPSTINRYRDILLKTVTGSTVNRRLDVISSMFTSFRKEWGYPVENPVLAIRRPKKAPPRDRRLSDAEINKLIKGNHTSPQLRCIIKIALETAMRLSEILRIDARNIEGNTLKIPVAKTKPRVIPLTKEAMSEIKNADLPFTLTKYSLDKQFRRLCKIYKLENVHFHDIRKNSLVNFMKDKNLSVPETMMIAGHSDPRMLLHTYNNLQVEHVAQKLNK